MKPMLHANAHKHLLMLATPTVGFDSQWLHRGNYSQASPDFQLGKSCILSSNRVRPSHWVPGFCVAITPPALKFADFFRQP